MSRARDGLIPGGIAGLVGGLLFGAAMFQLDLLPTITGPVGAETAVAGFIVHMVVAVVIGVGFGLLVWRQRPGAGETLFWGLAYGIFWWVLGPLTLLPLLQGQAIAWDIHAAQANFPALLGHVIYGATTGLTLAFIWRRGQAKPGAWALVRGGTAGLLAAWLLGNLLAMQQHLMEMAEMMESDSAVVAWLVTLVVGLLAGVAYAWLYPAPFDGAGAGLVRGSVYGFLWWVAGARTLVPLLSGHGLSWSLAQMQADFASLPGFLLFGTAVVLIYHWLHRLTQILLADHRPDANHEGAGSQGLRALGHGATAGVIGGLIFSLVMLQIGFFSTVASLVGATSETAGFLVHLLIAVLIGMSYGLLFRRQSYDLGSALGWGVSYGFVWWILGPLTLLPSLLGGVPQWTLTAVADTFAALIGHLAYGAGVGITFYLLEARQRPWWLTRSQIEAERVTRRKAQILSSAPALWVLVVVIALTLPVLLGM